MTALAGLIHSFAALLAADPGNDARLLQWITDARAAGLPDVHSFTRGLDLDLQAATAALTMPLPPPDQPTPLAEPVVTGRRQPTRTGGLCPPSPLVAQHAEDQTLVTVSRSLATVRAASAYLPQTSATSSPSRQTAAGAPVEWTRERLSHCGEARIADAMNFSASGT